ncbi:hypothetical protein ACHQM5_009849 [Ranunculus cassubicifolius]
MGKQCMELLNNKRRRRQTFSRRINGLKKGIQELTTLCDIEAAMISYGFDGEIETWPPDEKRVLEIITRYKSIPKEMREKNMLNLCTTDISISSLMEITTGEDELMEKNQSLDLTETALGDSNFESLEWDDLKLDELSSEELGKLEELLAFKCNDVQERIQNIKCSNNVIPETIATVNNVESCKEQSQVTQPSKQVDLPVEPRMFGCYIGGNSTQSTIRRHSPISIFGSRPPLPNHHIHNVPPVVGVVPSF